MVEVSYNGMTIFNTFAKLSFYTLINGSAIFVVEHDYSTGMWTSLAENTIVPNFKLTSFLNVDIPVPDENKTCSSFKNAILLFDCTFYDITFALGHPRIYMKHIFHSSPQTTMYALARKFNPSFKLSNINELNLQSNAIVLVPHI
ncbi:hypothetical protein HMI55_002176 [Coelomomyces lativittatus]|nr:hypothetical protein HMI55_002176 [Coelomomyces lativittatus]